MAETKNPKQSNQTMQHEKAKAEVSNPGRQDERDKLDHERSQNGAIGSKAQSQTGEPGRARNELDQQQREPAGER